VVCGAAACNESPAPDGLNGSDKGGAMTQHRLRVTRVGPGSGFVRSEPTGIVCAPDCEADFAAGATVELVAEPSPGSTFIGWGGECEGAVPVCALAMHGPRVVSAQFYGGGSGDAGVQFDATPRDSGAPVGDAGLGDASPSDASDADVVDGGDMDAGDLDAGVFDL